ncbi:histone acetyltransferase KAT2B-like [Limulus polyphemus]|uniref:Histone acetyltransferase KAT2B-like n=1 Tax=Limulus polyphemus TaxID=6850 RepID=A0ABM1SRS4_LIMPO|nr:histone acetyltransferase KAT2B-like [Limulus polyphemus]
MMNEKNMSSGSGPTEPSPGQSQLNSQVKSSGGESNRQNNLQRIAQKKAQVKSWPRNKKLEKLAIYSSCKAEDGCKCNGWKNPNPPPNPPRLDVSQPLASLNDPCRSCGHVLGAHVSHLGQTAEEELNRLLGIVVDVENLFMCVHKEEDADTKQVYFYLFKLLRKSILQMTKPSVEGPLGNPPFEKPNIAKRHHNVVAVGVSETCFYTGIFQDIFHFIDGFATAMSLHFVIVFLTMTQQLFLGELY